MNRKVFAFIGTLLLAAVVAGCKSVLPAWVIDFEEGADRQVVLFDHPEHTSFYRVISQSASEPARLEQYSLAGELLSSREIPDLCRGRHSVLADGHNGIYLTGYSLRCSMHIDLGSEIDRPLSSELLADENIHFHSKLVGPEGRLLFSGYRTITRPDEDPIRKGVIGLISRTGGMRLIDSYQDAEYLKLHWSKDRSELLLSGRYDAASDSSDGVSFLAHLTSELSQLDYQVYPFQITVDQVFADRLYAEVEIAGTREHGFYSHSMELIHEAPFNRYGTLGRFWGDSAVYVFDSDRGGISWLDVLYVCRYDIDFKQSWCRFLKSGIELEVTNAIVTDAGDLAFSYRRVGFPVTGAETGISLDSGMLEGDLLIKVLERRELEFNHVVFSESGKRLMSAAEQLYSYESTDGYCLVWHVDCTEDNLMNFTPGITELADVLYLPGYRIVSAAILADGPLEIDQGEKNQRLSYFDPKI